MTLDEYRAVLDRIEVEAELAAQAQADAEAQAEADALHARLTRVQKG